jgi:Fur family ferric uptake transcriptional regulator
MSEKYNTKQRQKILDLIQSQGVDFTAKDLYESAGHEIGLTTIYRCIESLEAEGIILRLSQENNTARYQYVEPCKHSDHFYLKCDRCGKLTHIDCEKTAGLTEHIAKEHHFLPTDTHIIISGHCASCAE